MVLKNYKIKTVVLRNFLLMTYMVNIQSSANAIDKHETVIYYISIFFLNCRIPLLSEDGTAAENNTIPKQKMGFLNNSNLFL